PRAAGGRPRRRLGGAGRGRADGHAPPRPAQPLRAPEGPHPRPGHHRGFHARLHRRPGASRRREAAPARTDARALHRPRRRPGPGRLSPPRGTAMARRSASLPFEVQGRPGQPLGMAPRAFLRDYWQKRPLLVRGAFPGYRAPIEPEDLAGLACEDGVLARLVRHDRARDAWAVSSGPFPESLFPTLGDRDWTLLVQDMDKWDPDIAALLPAFAFLPRWRVDDVMVSFAATGGSVGAHVDQYDVFLLQAMGHRRWQIDASVALGRGRPPLDFRDDAEIRLLRAFTPTHDWVLAPGDMLYLPPGVPHRGVAEDPCLTFSVGMRAPSVAELMGDYVDTLAAGADEALRYADPDLAPAADPNEIDAAAMGRVVEALNAVRMADA